MFIISITVNSDVSDDERNEKFPFHAEWLKKYYDAGNFLILGPCVGVDAHAGIIMARANSREDLQKILAEDCFYPHLASYEVKEFEPKFIADGLLK